MVKDSRPWLECRLVFEWCKCGERSELLGNYEGDIRDLTAFGFDGVKIDGCGAQRNQTLYRN